MKYSAVFFALAAGAFAMPQASTITSAPPTAASAALTPQQSCAIACPAGDVTCQAACLGIARPNSSQVVETNECAAGCDQGDGSPAATEKFSQCVQACISSHFPSSQTVPIAVGSAAASQAASNAASATGAAASAASSGASVAASGTGAKATGSATGTGAAATSSHTGAASLNTVHMAGAGLAGLLAIFAL